MDFLENALLAPVYYAGLFDGEGSVGLYMAGTTGRSRGKIGGYIQLSAKVTNSNIKPLLFLKAKFLGNIDTNHSSSKNENWMDVFSWRVYSDNAILFLEWIYPYTIIKNEQITVVKEFWSYYQPFRKNKYNRPDDNIINDYIVRLKELKRGI